MGANAQTSVPVFTAGQVLTAQQQTEINTGVPVFATTVTRDAAFGGTGEKTLAQGQLCYLEATDKVQFYNGTAWTNLGSVTNVDAFTASGTFTPPTGVTYAIAHILGGGGGVGASAGAGGNSSVAFAGGTITANGGNAYTATLTNVGATPTSTAGATNSGQGAFGSSFRGADNSDSRVGQGGNGAHIVAGGAVTPGTGITVTIGAGGTAGTNGAAGGSGYVWIEYQV